MSAVLKVVRARLAAHTDALAGADRAMRAGDAEGVHDARVACRHLRADLATFRTVLDRARTEPVRDELAWLVRALSAARDAHVVHARLAHLADHELAVHVVGPVRDRLDLSYAAALAGAEEDVQSTLASERYAAVVAALESWRSDPPWAPGAKAVTAADLEPELRRHWSRLVHRADLVAGAEDRDRALHDVRKAAKRLRYAAEAGDELWGDEARELARTAKGLTQALGDHQDTVVTRLALETLAADARADGDSDFTFGRLHAREQARALEADQEFVRRWRRARRHHG
ncbi:CHAD domain-containing protein [Nocardioides sp. LS1]|uniref:CHAD domain-containing protein n=1 Tax=Nocardioides sp. LS1 TaxID=1027620 RepID=UPI000F61CC40|nr:CHAD domain-containing protein [Nocardioides sp. LS1]GCD88980.1 hypothetical protein NLS1_09860 [Nocardioides sp. LS1]